MHKILVTSLRSEYDLISSSKLIAKLHSEHPHSEIHILTYKRFQETAALINYASMVHTISDDRIRQIFTGSLYHDGFGINIFMNDITEVLNTQWSLVVNHSNDNVSAYLISSLNFSRVIGTTISTTGAPATTGVFNEFLNNVSPCVQRQPINLGTLKRIMCSISENSKSTHPIVINSDHQKIAFQNLEKIRNTKTGSETIIVGISIAHATSEEELDTNSLEMIIEELEESINFKPVLLIDNNPIQKDVVNKLNKKFNNKIISICAETEALPGILVNLDVLISGTNKHLYLADVMGIRTIEITSKISAQKVNSAGSYSIITDQPSFYNEALFCLNIQFSEAFAVESATTQNRVYRLEKDEYGILYSQIQGPLLIQEELNYHIARIYSYDLLGQERNNQLLTEISKQCSQNDLNDYVRAMRAQITECSKHLLSTLRNLKNIHTSKENQKNFIKYLDLMITTSKDSLLTNIPVLLFEAEINNIEASDKEQSFKETEHCLYNLKNNFQKLSKILEILIEKNKSVPTNEVRQNLV